VDYGYSHDVSCELGVYSWGCVLEWIYRNGARSAMIVNFAIEGYRIGIGIL
jgi:hypothetical protein